MLMELIGLHFSGSDVQMIYDTLSEIQPCLMVELPQSTYNIGDVFTKNFQFITDPSWDLNGRSKMLIIMEIDKSFSASVNFNFY